MSHGPASDSAIEPNLTPLLDLVLQLLMFFMITVNFTQGVTNTGESLPHSETISTVAETGGEPIILSVKPFRMARNPDPDPTKGPRDDFRSYTKDERARLRARFQDNEICVLDPTEQLTDQEKDAGRTSESLIRNLFNAGEKLHLIAEAEKKLNEREKQNKVAPNKRKARVDDSNPNDVKVLIPIHIRADGDVKTGDIYQLMDAAKEAGFVNIKARALLETGKRNTP